MQNSPNISLKHFYSCAPQAPLRCCKFEAQMPGGNTRVCPECGSEQPVLHTRGLGHCVCSCLSDESAGQTLADKALMLSGRLLHNYRKDLPIISIESWQRSSCKISVGPASLRSVLSKAFWTWNAELTLALTSRGFISQAKGSSKAGTVCNSS